MKHRLILSVWFEDEGKTQKII